MFNFRNFSHRLQISDEKDDDDESNEETKLFQPTTTRFQNFVTLFKSTNANNNNQASNMQNLSTFVEHKPPLRNYQGRKVPPKPPIRRQSAIRHEPEGMTHVQFAASFQEKKTFQLAVVQKLAREPLKPPAPQTSTYFNQKHLLNPSLQVRTTPFLPPPFVPNHQQQPMQPIVFGIHNSHQNFNNFHQQQQMFLHPQLKQQQLVIAGMQMRMSVTRNRHNGESHGSGGGSSGSDPENHIYEMIDEHEADSQSKLLANQPTQLFQQQKVQVEEPPPKASENLFQKMLRTEMTNQIQLCKNNGFLSHLPQEKRMDIIQETALSLATEAYVEK